jgi:trk system potassium uptake protein TrkH
VGLSAGATARLAAAGKLLIAAIMFVGRIGPLTLAFAMAARQHAHRVRYPDEKIMIG